MTDGLLEVVGLGFRHADAAADAAPAIEEISFRVPAGGLVAVVGPSGSGKTTLLRCVAGLARPTAGEVRLDGRSIDGVPDATAVVFQEYGRSLFPWMSVRENVDLPLRRLGLAPAERRSRISEALAEVGLAGTEASYPWQLSGGMQQRVAIARAMAYRPRLLLMDEPFASVDAQVRGDLQELTLAVWHAHRSTVLFVTHDIDEAVYLADRVIVLSQAPASVVADVPIDLPRPRDQIVTRASAAFAERRAEVARLIRRP